MPFDGSAFHAPRPAIRPPLPPTWRFSPGPWAAWRRRLARLSPCRIGSVVLLKRARALVACEETWVQGHYSGDGSYCAVGALLEAGGRKHPSWLREATSHLLLVARQRGFCSIEDMNDRCVHADMLEAFDAAVALAWGDVA